MLQTLAMLLVARKKRFRLQVAGDGAKVSNGFNPEKHEVMHLGKCNKAKECTINGMILCSLEEQRYSGMYNHTTTQPKSSREGQKGS